MPVAPVDAASVVLLRDGDAGGLEVLLVRRHERSTDFAGASVFPGGIVETADRIEPLPPVAESLAAALGEPGMPESALALHVAACRELFEEAAILLGHDGEGRPCAEHATALRRALRADNFHALLASRGIVPSIDALVPLARWITPEQAPRRWDTRFFVAATPDGQLAQCDAQETCEALWLRPQDALAGYRAGEHLLAPPTFRILEELAPFSRTAEAVASAAAAGPPRTILPVPLAGTATVTMVYPGDREYPGGEFSGTNRIVLDHGRWRSERSP